MNHYLRKTFIAFALIIISSFALSGCSNTTEGGIDRYAVRNQLDAFIEEGMEDGSFESMRAFWYDQADTGKVFDFEKLDDRNGTIVFGTRTAKPFSFLMDNKWTGYTIEIIYNFCKEYGYGIEIRDFGDNNSVVMATATENCDIGGANISISEERKKNVDFSPPYYRNILALAINKDDHDKYKTLEDFEGVMIGTQTGSTINDFAPQKIKNFKHQEFNTLSDGCLALSQNKVEAMSDDEITLHYAMKSFSNLEFTCPLDDKDVFGFVYPKEDKTGGIWSNLKLSFKRTFIDESRWKLILTGVGNTLLITLASIIAGAILGFLMYLRCRKEGKIANGITRFCQWFIDGLPAIVFLMIFYYLIFGSVHMNNVLVSCIAFSLIFASAIFTIVKTAVMGVDYSQYEVSYALGYTEKATFFKMILPQAARLFWEPCQAAVKTQIKATAIVGYIAAVDITKAGDMIRSSTFEVFFPLLVVAALYFILGWLLTMIVDRIRINTEPSQAKSERYLKGVRTHD